MKFSPFKSFRELKARWGFLPDGDDPRLIGHALGGGVLWLMALATIACAAMSRSWFPAIWFVAGWVARSAITTR